MMKGSHKLRPNILISFVLGVVYAAFYDYIVRDYVFSVFNYYVKYNYYRLESEHLFLYLMICAVPLMFYKGIKHFSGAFTFFTYLLAYVPMMNTLFVAGYPKNISQPYVEALFISMVFIFITDGIVLGKKFMLKKRKRFSFRQMEILTVILLGVVVVTNISRVRFVNIFTDSSTMYDFREENLDEMRSGYSLYLIGWLNQVFIPLLMVAYLHTKQYLKYAASFGAMILMFMLDMQKLTFLMPFVITAVYFIYKSNPFVFLKNFHVLIFLAMMVFPFLCNAFRDNPLVSGIAFVLIFRTQCIEGVELNTYLSFFDLNEPQPYTWYTHIGIVRKIFGGYPYKGPLGRVVTGGGGNANGMFWLMDGLAAGGPVGIYIITIVFVLFKSLFTSIEYKMNKELALCVLIFAIASMMNVSLFTALLSGGIIVFYLVVLFVDLSVLNTAENPVTNVQKSERNSN